MDDMTKQAVDTLAAAIGTALYDQIAPRLHATALDAIQPLNGRLDHLSSELVMVREWAHSETDRIEVLESTSNQIKITIESLGELISVLARKSECGSEALLSRVAALNELLDAEAGKTTAVAAGAVALQEDLNQLRVDTASLKTAVDRLGQALESIQGEGKRFHYCHRRLLIAAVVFSIASVVASLAVLVWGAG